MSGGVEGNSLARSLVDLGVRPGATVLVHVSLRRVGAGPEAFLAALLDVLGPEGTVVVPAFTAGNSDTSPDYLDRTRGMTHRQRVLHRALMPPFERDRTPSERMGAFAEAVRRAQGAVRSAHPQTSFAALGARSGELMGRHDEECHLGERSPLARLERAGAYVLLLGVGYEVCTAFHLGEYRVPHPPRRLYRCVVLRGGVRTWMSYEDVALDDRDFGILGSEFEAGGTTVVARGRFGDAQAVLFPLAQAVEFAVSWLAGNRQ
ncbi:AAC(3) family N-acetyltransferase [Streptomyces sp. NPDC047061]|uniref:aminoglycoside N(3)-acetyltransferase n=1 Tax=Streptomyces sp. NPDC047061 TaxID=3154605 RepID=UPI0034071965